eukprot:UN04481
MMCCKNLCGPKNSTSYSNYKKQGKNFDKNRPNRKIASVLLNKCIVPDNLTCRFV